MFRYGGVEAVEVPRRIPPLGSQRQSGRHLKFSPGLRGARKEGRSCVASRRCPSLNAKRARLHLDPPSHCIGKPNSPHCGHSPHLLLPQGIGGVSNPRLLAPHLLWGSRGYVRSNMSIGCFNKDWTTLLLACLLAATRGCTRRNPPPTRSAQPCSRSSEVSYISHPPARREKDFNR